MAKSAETTEDAIRADIAVIRSQLGRVERDARRLMWAKERPWKVGSHVWGEDFMPVVDLHDLSVNLGKKTVDRITNAAPNLKSGAVSFITGQGKNAIGPGQMKPAIASALRSACERNPRWSFRPDGPGRYVLILDPDKAAPQALSSLPQGFWILIVLFGAALVFAVLRNLIGF